MAHGKNRPGLEVSVGDYHILDEASQPGLTRRRTHFGTYKLVWIGSSWRNALKTALFPLATRCQIQEVPCPPWQVVVGWQGASSIGVNASPTTSEDMPKLTWLEP